MNHDTAPILTLRLYRHHHHHHHRHHHQQQQQCNVIAESAMDGVAAIPLVGVVT